MSRCRLHRTLREVGDLIRAFFLLVVVEALPEGLHTPEEMLRHARPLVIVRSAFRACAVAGRSLPSEGCPSASAKADRARGREVGCADSAKETDEQDAPARSGGRPRRWAAGRPPTRPSGNGRASGPYLVDRMAPNPDCTGAGLPSGARSGRR